MLRNRAPCIRFTPIAILICVALFEFALVRAPGVAAAAPRLTPLMIGCDTAVFGGATSYGAGSSPRGVAVADFNRDGKLDLATANINSANATVLLGNGLGGFGSATGFSAGSGPISITVGDFNNDDKPDLATANFGSANVSVLLGNGLGGFASAVSFGVGTFPFFVTTGDFNLDGNPDLVTANAGSNNISLLFGDGEGGFAAANNIGVGSLPRSVAVGDLNHDNKPDLVVANQGADNTNVFLGDGTGSFAAVPGPATGDSPTSIVIADLNLDTHPDLASANSDGFSVSVMLGNGMGGFTAPTNFSVVETPWSIAAGDFNLDGKPDLVVTNYAVSSVTVLVGNGMGGFSGMADFTVGANPRSAAIGDFNRDGTPDLATANEGASTVSVLLNACLGIQPRVGHFAAAGGQGSFMLTVPAGFDWTAESNVDWVTVDTPSGAGSATVQFTLAPNLGAVRSGTITISGQSYTVKQGANFADVAPENPFYEVIGKLSAAGITSGCGQTQQGEPLYCPGSLVTRDQMAVFIIRSTGEFNPPAPSMQRFLDVPPENPFYAFIEEMAVRGITIGCGGGNYCPESPVSREQMAAFMIRALGQFTPPTPSMQRFLDVPPENPFYAFIEEMAVRGITVGCGGGNYCPSNTVTREQMAAFLVRAFGL